MKLSICIALVAVLIAATPIGGAIAAPAPTPLYTQNFDSLADGTVNTQAGWKVTAGSATVAASEGRGKAISIAYPYTTASAEVPSSKGYDLFTVRFSAKFTTKPDGGAKATQKLIFYVNDSAGKALALVFHDANGQWGIKSGDRYNQSTLANATEPWTMVEVTFDTKEKRYTLKLTNGATSLTLFDSVGYADPAAGDMASLTFQRNGQGDEGLCWIDDVAVEKAVVKTADRLNAWIADAPRFNVIASGYPVVVHIEAERVTMNAADKLDYSVTDYLGHSVKAGELSVPSGSGKWEASLPLGTLPSGYYALSGSFRNQGLAFAARGSQPENNVAFGVLPALTALPLKHADDSRFGMQGTVFLKSGVRLVGDPYDPVYSSLGAKWINFPGEWDRFEPDSDGQFDIEKQKVLGGEPLFASQHGMAILTTTHGVPRWAMAVPATVQTAATNARIDSQAYPPKDYAKFEDFTTRMAKRTDSIRRNYFRSMAHNWYQIGWEPDWHWKGTPQEYVDMAAHSYAAIHRGDPTAQVLGPGTGVYDKTIEWLRTMLPLGLGKYMDGIATHAYYLGEGDPFHPSAPGQIHAPEDQRTIENTREVKKLARQYLKSGARIVQSEWGLDYKGSYALATPQMLCQLAAYIVRGHIILLGEGVDTSYFFYTADYQGENGFGMMFNLTMPNPNFGAIAVSPKPEYMASAAMTRVLEGTKTIGPLSGLPADVHAYAFDRAGKTVVAVWKAHPGSVTVSLPLAGANASVIDFMGNQSLHPAPSKSITLNLTEYPVYIEGVATGKLTLKTP
ncbi:MAG TPA: hypothetical protein VGK19_19320 [Capsulimonadaceae bacterium]|jgi:hypothetical protein